MFMLVMFSATTSIQQPSISRKESRTPYLFISGYQLPSLAKINMAETNNFH